MSSNLGHASKLDTNMSRNNTTTAKANQTNPNPNMKAFGFLQHTQSSEMRNHILKMQREVNEPETNENRVKTIPNVVPEGHFLAAPKTDRLTVIRQISPTKLNKPQQKKDKQRSEGGNTPEPTPYRKKKSKKSAQNLEIKSEGETVELQKDEPKKPDVDGEKPAPTHQSMKTSQSQKHLQKKVFGKTFARM